ncbi:MAG: acyl-CoA thioesterase [Rhodospirillales bacterium]|nr:acyl-CoA thioesterase [Rhodospirillales bacterium]
MPLEYSLSRADYFYWTTISTRWSDNDQLGHVNNVLYFRYFEAAVVAMLIEEAQLDWRRDPLIPYAVDVRCQFRQPLTFPEVVEAGLNVARLGTTSVTYGLALFARNDSDPAAVGHFVHVYVERQSESPVAIPDPIRAVYQRYYRPEPV